MLKIPKKTSKRQYKNILIGDWLNLSPKRTFGSLARIISNIKIAAVIRII